MRVSFSYKNYPNSRGASVLSAVGGFLKAVGIPLILLFGMGIILIGIGFGMQKLADVLNDKKTFKLWMKSLRDNGVLAQVPNNTELGVKLYEANPSKKTLKYLKKANPQAVLIIKNKAAAKNVDSPASAQAGSAAGHNVDRDKYEALYHQLGSELLQQEYAVKTAAAVQEELEGLLTNIDLLNQQNNGKLLMIYAYLAAEPKSIDPKIALIKAEYTYRLLRSRNCERY